MDPTFLAQTMINVAQNLLSAQQQAVSRLYVNAVMLKLYHVYNLEPCPEVA